MLARLFFQPVRLAGTLLLLTMGCSPTSKPVDSFSPVVSEMNRGVGFMGQYLYGDAVKSFESVLQASPDLTEARINLAIALFNRNGKEDIGAAEKQLAQVLQKEPNNLRAIYFKAIILQHVGKAEEAVPLLTKVVQAAPQDAVAWYVLGLCKQRANLPAEAELLKAVELRPYLFSAYYQLYQLSMRAGDQAKGMEYMEHFKVLRASPLGESVELPQYNQMGELALARPLPATTPPLTSSRYQLKPLKTVLSWAAPPEIAASRPRAHICGITAADWNGDGLVDLVASIGKAGRTVLLLHRPTGEFADATTGSGLEGIGSARSCAVGDFDNDDVPDLFTLGENGPHLFKGKGDGTFTDVTQAAGLNTASAAPESALFLDADHDGDLDLIVCGLESSQLWNNNGDGNFTNLTAQAGLGPAQGHSVLVLPGDLDGDRDQDLIFLREGQAARVFQNELLARYRETELAGLPIRGDAGGALQDFNGDGHLDLLVLGSTPAELKLYLGDGKGSFKPDASFDATAAAAGSRGTLRGLRVADIDLDGDLDLVVFGSDVSLLLNDGRGHFVLQSPLWKPSPGTTIATMEVFDVTGDLVPDLLAIEEGATNRLWMAAGELVPPSTALTIQPSGIRGRDGRTRSPASGYGISMTARFGLREAHLFYTGQTGGFNQSAVPGVLGLAGASKADFVHLVWSDGVAQAETSLTAGQTHRITELQRKISSCPVLFAWNGSRFDFVTDFAGVGGLGYLAAPGVYASPQVLEHVKIEPGHLCLRNGCYELRVAEPMEETAYLDKLELLTIDHAVNEQVFPDERLAVGGSAPTHDLVVVDHPIFPVRALAPSGQNCAENLGQVDRVYGYAPKLDRRYIGFCEPHTLELDFEDALTGFAAADRVYLFINGSIEYPYSQTVYAASQSRIQWAPIRVQRQDPDGSWRTIVEDGGAPGGVARTMTIDLTGHLNGQIHKLRLTTNLEILYDQIFIARAAARDGIQVRTVPLKNAILRPLGYPREYSPDGQLPLIYDYDVRDATAPFGVLKGAYTRYGSVIDLLNEYDDRFVLVGPGDEVALEFDAKDLPPLEANRQRSFVLVSHAYCKDMDLYTATPQTVAPLPFRGMTRYPYPASEHYPTGTSHRQYLQSYNTRLQE